MRNPATKIGSEAFLRDLVRTWSTKDSQGGAENLYTGEDFSDEEEDDWGDSD
jgi:hypothetical protein